MVGLDEVGRGCWAGPLVAGAVILNQPVIGLKDSKKLSKLQRERLAAEIQVRALAIGLGWVGSSEIDELGLTKAVRLAMQRALAEINTSYNEIIIDGNYNFLNDTPNSKAVIGADNIVPAVSAASIIAKVARDNYMRGQASKAYPQYEFDKHVGYGTKLHRDRLQAYGVCKLHRLSYKPVQAFATM